VVARSVHGGRSELPVGGAFHDDGQGSAKFSQHADLGNYLLGTGSRILVEASPVDRVWGIGLAATDEHAASPEHWPGLNLLGFALMEVRAQLSSLASAGKDGP
jgi:predicted NAD-dependent protein-ADP-ribosyltransferase YbiA (DUF1768 family)